MNLSGADMQMQEMQDRLAAVTAERDDYIARFRDLEHELHLERGQTVLMTQRAAAAEAALALATNSTPGKTTGVWVPLDKWQLQLAKMTEIEERVKALLAQRDALQVDAGALVRLRDDTDNILWALKPADVPGAINWGDLGARETQGVIDESRRWYRVIIEEADPANPVLHAAVLAGLVACGWKADDVEIETAW